MLFEAGELKIIADKLLEGNGYALSVASGLQVVSRMMY